MGLELDDIQGILARGYANLRAACYVLIRIREANAAREWLASPGAAVTSAGARPDARALNLAVSPGGLRALGVPAHVLEGFSREFVAGMADPNRSRLLGDVGENAPQRWTWGGPSNSTVDLILLMYAKDEAELSRFSGSLSGDLGSNGLEQVMRLDTTDLGGREHFGFRDGVSQPVIEGLSRTGSASNTLKAGEFILGYPNEYGLYTDRPMVPSSDGPGGVLLQDVAGSGRADLGRNGSYLAFRQLRQDVVGFWGFLDRATRAPDGTANPKAQARLAAKMVGRWPDGASLVLAPEEDNPGLSEANDFGYFAQDRLGLRCPIGAHVRRANPRDSLDPQPGSQKSIDVGKRHRILRRGREYGPPITPEQLQAGVAGTEDRGLHFICLNANLARQFEFIHHTWINNTKFAGLYDDPDPLVGPRRGTPDAFTIQAHPVRTRLKDLPGFVTVRGGGYFFLPGLRALRYLSTQGT
ncbi:MAG: Dyp-type peroxidase [Candidatus Dormibacteria bacterium]